MVYVEDVDARVAQAVAAGAQAHAAGREPVLRRSHRRHRRSVRLSLVHRHARRGRPAGRAREARGEGDGRRLTLRLLPHVTCRSPTNAALAAVLANPAIWRGGDCAPEPAAMPIGLSRARRRAARPRLAGRRADRDRARARRHRRDPPHAAGARAAAGAAPRRRLDRAAARAVRAGARRRGARSRAAPDRPLPQRRR